MSYKESILLIFCLVLFKFALGQKITLEPEPKNVFYFSNNTIDYFYYKDFIQYQGVTFTTTQGIIIKKPDSPFCLMSESLGGSISPNSQRLFLESRFFINNNVTALLFDIGHQFGFNAGLHVMFGLGINFRVISIFNLSSDIGADINSDHGCGIVFLRLGLMLKKHIDRKNNN